MNVNVSKNAIPLLLTLAFFPMAQASDLLTHSRYDALKNEFLNIDPQYISEMDIASMSSAELANFLGGKAVQSPLLLEEKTGGLSGTQNIFGANHSCNSKYGDQSLCWLNTGGTMGVKNDPNCGSSTNNNYVEASTNTSLHCQTPNTPWSGYRFWLGTGNSTEFLAQQFPNNGNMPVNRFCAEIEFPSADKLNLAYSDTRSDIIGSPHLSQLVNPAVAGSHLRNIMWEWGTYTATKTTAEGTTRDQEYGGAYVKGGSHFYHKQTHVGRTPADRLYAIDDTTLVACMGETPTGIRSGMGTSYAANPLLSIGHHDSNGITTAPNYLNYITRVYWQAEMDPNSVANYPLTIKVNKIWAMYEKNDIIALADGGKTMSVDMVQNGGTAYYPFTIHNDANNDRTYRIFVAMGANTTFKNLSQTVNGDAVFKVYQDLNGNKLLDDNERNAELIPQETITLAANTNAEFIIEHRPDFSRVNDSKILHNRRYVHGSISLIEDGRMRSAGFMVRTWEGSATDIANKYAFFEQSKYPVPGDDWDLYHDYNLGKNPASNPDLVRNTPDYQALAPVLQSVDVVNPIPPNPPGQLNARLIAD